MNIKELCERTGITKRNVYFYVKEGLVSPSVKESNGYYEFSEEDFKRLFLVHEFRNAGLSIEDIRHVLKSPTSANYYLRNYKRMMERNMRRMERTSHSIDYILGGLPVNPSFNDVYELVLESGIPGEEDPAFTLGSDEYDNHLVNQLLWRMFLPEGKLTPYQQYLWDRINHMTSTPDNEDYRALTGFFRSLNGEEVEALYSRMTDYSSFIAGLDYEACIKYAIHQRTALTEFLENEKAIALWKNWYDSYFAPCVRIYASEIRLSMAEISPLFASYQQNIILTCEMIYRWLLSTEGYPILTKLNDVLGDKLDLEEANHGQIEGIVTVPGLL